MGLVYMCKREREVYTAFAFIVLRTLIMKCTFLTNF